MELEVTTIAYDGKNIAVDTRVAGGFMHTHSKVQTLPDGSRGAGAGIVSEIDRFFRNFFGDPSTIPEGEYETLVMHLDGRVVHYNGDGLCLDVTGKKYAIGSGADFALGAMHAGKSAAMAVKIACALDPHSGEPVEVIRAPRV